MAKGIQYWNRNKDGERNGYDLAARQLHYDSTEAAVERRKLLDERLKKLVSFEYESKLRYESEYHNAYDFM